MASKLSIVIGDPLSGRTSMAKMLFSSFSIKNECGLLCDGSRLNTYNVNNLRKVLEKIFEEEYHVGQIETYRQLPPNQKVLIIDNFQDIPYHDDRRSKILSVLLNEFQNIIIFAESALEMQVVCSKVEGLNNTDMKIYHILSLGNQKRRELIEKWYYLGNEYARGDRQIEDRIDRAYEKIDILLGIHGGIVPALPIYLIDLLQNIDSVAPASYAGSQYGFLYESLINKSLSTIGRRYPDSGSINIDINILSQLAFKMLQDNKYSFTTAELLAVANVFEEKMKVSINKSDIISKMLEAKLIKEVEVENYIFRYPYVFYYFSGRYIAYHLQDRDVKDQLEYMSDRLYRENFGNILIFTCHFANSVEIIEDVLLHAYETLSKYAPFDFDKHREFFSRAQERVDSVLIPKRIGTDAEVDQNKRDELARRDNEGIRDGSAKMEQDEMSDELAEKEEALAAVSAAMRIMDVLGQILCNYPGDVDGELKIQIIDEIHSLGMRTTEVMFSAVGFVEQDLILFISEQAKEKVNPNIQTEVIRKTKEMLSAIMASTAKGMIRKIAMCYNNHALLPAIREAFSASKSLSQNLVLQELTFNLLKKPDIENAISLENNLERNKNYFAQAVLKSIAAHYLRYNHCSYDTRQRLCSNFGFHDGAAFIERQKADKLL